MKRLSRNLLIATTLLAGVCFTSCGNDDSPVDDPKDTPSNNQIKPMVKIARPVKQIQVVETWDGETYYTTTTTMGYDESNRLVSFCIREGDEPDTDVALTYDDNKVVISGLIDGDNSTYTYILDNEGKATKCEYLIKRGGEQEKDGGTIDFEYSSKRLTYISDPRAGLSHIVYNDKGDLIGFNDNYHDYSFVSSNVENVSNIIDPGLWEDPYWCIQAAHYAGILGYTSSHLSVSCTMKSNHGYGLESDRYTYTIKKNADGTIASISQFDNDDKTPFAVYTYSY